LRAKDSSIPTEEAERVRAFDQGGFSARWGVEILQKISRR
jgi:hypothetical protein